MFDSAMPRSRAARRAAAERIPAERKVVQRPSDLERKVVQRPSDLERHQRRDVIKAETAEPTSAAPPPQHKYENECSTSNFVASCRLA